MAIVRSGKHAVTHYRILTNFSNYTHIELSIETGRTHQIRVHMMSLNHSLLGDPVYGGSTHKNDPSDIVLGNKLQPLDRQALHARSLEFKHPGNNKTMLLETPLPCDMSSLLAVLNSTL